MPPEDQPRGQEENARDLANTDTDAWVAARPGPRLGWLWVIAVPAVLLLGAGTLSNWVLARRAAADLAAARGTLATLAERAAATDRHLAEQRQQLANTEARVRALHDAWARSQEQTRRELSRVGDELSVFIRRAAVAAPNWELVFEDTFERDALGPDWDYNPDQCSCMIADGWLDASTDKVVLCASARDFRGNIRLEYDVRGVGKGYTSDMSAYICAQLGRPLRVAQGYFVGFGSDWNRLTKIVRDGLGVAQRPLRLDTDRTYQMTIERVGPDVIGYVDGAPVIHFTDPAPIRGDEQSRVVLYAYQSHVQFDNVRVYRLKNGPSVRGVPAR